MRARDLRPIVLTSDPTALHQRVQAAATARADRARDAAALLARWRRERAARSASERDWRDLP